MMSAGEHQMARSLGVQIHNNEVLTCPGWCNDGGSKQPLCAVGDEENMLFCPHCDLGVEVLVRPHASGEPSAGEISLTKTLGKQICSRGIRTCPECGKRQPLVSYVPHNRHILFCLRCGLIIDLIVNEHE